MTDYRPIACDQYSLLEVLALERLDVIVDYVDERGDAVSLSGVVIDMHSRNGAEFLVLEGAGQRVDLRLDRLREICRPNGESLWRQKPGKS